MWGSEAILGDRRGWAPRGQSAEDVWILTSLHDFCGGSSCKLNERECFVMCTRSRCPNCSSFFSSSVPLTMNGPHKRFRHLMFENRLRTTCYRFSQSFTLPDEEIKLQLSGGNRWREPAVRWFGLSFAFFSQCIERFARQYRYSTRVSLDFAFHTDTHTHIHIYAQTHAYAYAHATHTQRHKRTLT